MSRSGLCTPSPSNPVSRVSQFFAVVTMEVSAAQRPRGNRPRASFTSSTSSRPYSRSSTRTPSARMQSQGNNDSTSNTTSSPSLRNGVPPISSRQSNRKGSMGSTIDRPPTPISKSSLKESHSSTQQEPQSTLLQEKLQKERRSEIQRNLNRLAGEMSSSGPADLRAATSTPVRCATADGRRPESKEQNGDDGKKRGPALKEMEQVPRPNTSPNCASGCEKTMLKGEMLTEYPHRQCQLCISRTLT